MILADGKYRFPALSPPLSPSLSLSQNVHSSKSVTFPKIITQCSYNYYNWNRYLDNLCIDHRGLSMALTLNMQQACPLIRRRGHGNVLTNM